MINTGTPASYHAVDLTDLVDRAIEALTNHLANTNEITTSPTKSKQLAALHLTGEPAEHFCVMWLSNKNQLIKFERLFAGTVNSSSVHPREVVRAALHHNATAAILCHNHTSGDVEPSRADLAITRTLVDTLALIDVNVLDHIIVGVGASMSFAEKGLIVPARTPTSRRTET